MVDVLESRSRLLEMRAVDARRATVAEHVRQALASLWAQPGEPRSRNDRLLLERALKAQNHLPRPFFRAEPHTKRWRGSQRRRRHTELRRNPQQPVRQRTDRSVVFQRRYGRNWDRYGTSPHVCSGEAPAHSASRHEFARTSFERSPPAHSAFQFTPKQQMFKMLRTKSTYHAPFMFSHWSTFDSPSIHIFGKLLGVPCPWNKRRPSTSMKPSYAPDRLVGRSSRSRASTQGLEFGSLPAAATSLQSGPGAAVHRAPS